MQGRAKQNTPPREMDTNQLISQEIDELLGNSMLSTGKELEQLETELAEQEEKHKHEILQIETYTMMAKYQIMFLKLEDKLKKLAKLAAKHKFTNQQHFFAILKRDRLKDQLSYQVSLIQFKDKIATLLVAAGAKRRLGHLVCAFEHIRTRALVARSFAKEDEKIERLTHGIIRCDAIKNTFGKRKPSNLLKKSTATTKLTADEGYTDDTEIKDRSMGYALSKNSNKKGVSNGILKQKRQENAVLKLKLTKLLECVESFVSHIDETLDQFIKPEQ